MFSNIKKYFKLKRDSNKSTFDKLFIISEIVGSATSGGFLLIDHPAKVEKYGSVLIFTWKNYVLEVYKDKFILKRKGKIFVKRVFELKFKDVKEEYDKEVLRDILDHIKYAERKIQSDKKLFC